MATAPARTLLIALAAVLIVAAPGVNAGGRRYDREAARKIGELISSGGRCDDRSKHGSHPGCAAGGGGNGLAQQAVLTTSCDYGVQ